VILKTTFMIYLTWSPHSLITGMLMSSIKMDIFFPAGGP